MKLRMTESISDMGYNDVIQETFEYDVPEGTTLLELLEHFLRVENKYTDEEIEKFRDMLKTGRWSGGEWIDEGNRVLFNSDVSWTKFEIVD